MSFTFAISLSIDIADQRTSSQGSSNAVRVGTPATSRGQAAAVRSACVGSANFHERVTDGVRAWQQHEAPDGVSSGTS
jgi:hypothetical protein